MSSEGVRSQQPSCYYCSREPARQVTLLGWCCQCGAASVVVPGWCYRCGAWCSWDEAEGQASGRGRGRG